MPKNKPPEIIISFEQNPNIQDEFIEFVKEVLSWNEDKNESKEICKKNR